jgi:hypothetical protein
MILGATVQKLWEFEVFRWTLGRVGLCWNQPARVDYLCKKWRATQKKNSKKRGKPTLSRHRPTAGGRSLVVELSATNGRARVSAGQLDPDCWSLAAWRPEVVDPRSWAQGRPATSGRPPAAGWNLDRVGLVHFFWIFFFWCFLLHFGQFFIGVLENGPRLLGEWMHSTPIFSSLPLHLEVSNLPFLIEFGDFTFFEILFSLNLE